MANKKQDRIKDLKDLGKAFGLPENNDTDSESKNEKKTSKYENNYNYLTEHKNNISENRKARAPYNFIPLNEKVVKSDFSVDNKPFNKYHKDLLTGYINLGIETKTPVYIRDSKKINDNEESTDFFSPDGGKLRIPGSSLRGLTRNLSEIVTYGKFLNFENKRLFFRGLADKSNLRYEYQDLMVNTDGNFFPKVEAGFLAINQHGEYVIYPSIKDNGNAIYRVNFNKSNGNISISGTPPTTISPFEFKKIFFKREPVVEHKHTRKQKDKKTGKIILKDYILKYALVKNISITNNPDCPHNGYLIASGPFQNKHMHWIINEPDKNFIRIDKKIINEYLNDENRKGINLIDKLTNNKLVPCFYILKDGDVFAFGHTGMFRIPYRNNISANIPSDLNNCKNIDITEAIFGNEADFSGRVFFEDAFCYPDDKMNLNESEMHPKILSGPKPTTFQHYVVQDKEDIKELKNYNPFSGDKISAIRGYKQYWHKSGENWAADISDVNKSPTQYTKINPVKKGTKFSGKIRFENLSDYELGALLFVLDLPENCCHKIGMGKPLGLGSIRITPELFISDREKRYKDFLEEINGCKKETDLNKYKNNFEKKILQNIGNGKSESLWDIDRIKQLRKMLDFNNKPGDEETSYMQIEPFNEFKDRKVLPRPDNVIDT